MTTVYKVLGQQKPSANTLTTVYTVPSNNSAVLSTITICNQGADNATYKLAVQKNGAAIQSNHYIAFGATVLSGDTVALTFGITMSSGDILSANISTANVSINAFGSEVY